MPTTKTAETTPADCTAAIKLADALRALGVRALAKSIELQRDDGSWGKIVRVEVAMTDAKHGNTVVRTISAVDAASADPAKVVAEMQREIKARAKGTRSRIRAEREST